MFVKMHFAVVMSGYSSWHDPGYRQSIIRKPCLQPAGLLGFSLSALFCVFIFFPVYGHPIVLHIPASSRVILMRPRRAHSALFVRTREGERDRAGLRESRRRGSSERGRPGAPRSLPRRAPAWRSSPKPLCEGGLERGVLPGLAAAGGPR